MASAPAGSQGCMLYWERTWRSRLSCALEVRWYWCVLPGPRLTVSRSRVLVLGPSHWVLGSRVLGSVGTGGLRCKLEVCINFLLSKDLLKELQEVH